MIPILFTSMVSAHRSGVPEVLCRAAAERGNAQDPLLFQAAEVRKGHNHPQPETNGQRGP